MTTQYDVGVPSGFDLIGYTIKNSDGYAIGGSGTLVAGDPDGSPMLRLVGAQTVDPSLPESETVTAIFDDGPGPSRIFAATDNPSSVIELGVVDFEAVARMIGGTVRSKAGAQFIVLGPTSIERPDLMMVFQHHSQSWAAGYKNAEQRGGVWVPSIQVDPLGYALNQRQYQVNRLKMTIGKSDKHVTGESMIAGVDGFTDGTTFPFQGPYAQWLHSFMGNNSVDEFNLVYTPLTPATLSEVYVNGVKQAYTTDYTIAAKVLTFVSAPAANAVIECLFNFSRTEL